MFECVEKKIFCWVCELVCGMVVVVEDGEFMVFKFDKEYFIIKGFVCYKGIYGFDIYNDFD